MKQQGRIGGVLSNYVGEAGVEYFKLQRGNDFADARLNLHLFESYLSPDLDVLDFGCGGGFLLQLLPGKNKAGVEINPAAREVGQSIGLNCYAVLDEVPGQWDRIISSHALEHVPRPCDILEKIRAKLRGPDSKLILLLPLDDWRNCFNRRYDPEDKNRHLHAWTPQTLGNLLAASGFDVESVRVVDHAWPPNRLRLWRISPALFHLVAKYWAQWKMQRQLLAIARPLSD